MKGRRSLITSGIFPFIVAICFFKIILPGDANALTINNGAAYTNNASVSLAVDIPPYCMTVAVSDDQGGSSSLLCSIAPQGYDLAPGDGLRTVTADVTYYQPYDCSYYYDCNCSCCSWLFGVCNGDCCDTCYQQQTCYNYYSYNQQSTITLDTVPPQLISVTPSGTTNDPYSDIVATFSDVTSGINVESVSLTLDGNVLSNCSTTESQIDCTSSNVSGGSHVIGGSVSDNAGNSSAVDGSFTLVYLPVRLDGTDPLYYPGVQEAFNAAAQGDIIECEAQEFVGDMDFNQTNVSALLDGGYDSAFSSKSGITAIAGSLTVSQGTLTVEDISID
jgi:hypothetical protein